MPSRRHKIRIYPKTSGNFFHKQVIRWRNEKMTLRQPVQVTGSHGLIHIASRVVRTTRQQNQAVQVMEVQPAAHAFAHHASDQSGLGRGNAIIVPPPDILRASIQPQRMQIVQQNRHLQMSVRPQNKKMKM
jgi:hypothetical protein